jgi:hypothetical protein
MPAPVALVQATTQNSARAARVRATTPPETMARLSNEASTIWGAVQVPVAMPPPVAQRRTMRTMRPDAVANPTDGEAPTTGGGDGGNAVQDVAARRRALDGECMVRVNTDETTIHRAAFFLIAHDTIGLKMTISLLLLK